jgi:hypothetical protein
MVMRCMLGLMYWVLTGHQGMLLTGETAPTGGSSLSNLYESHVISLPSDPPDLCTSILCTESNVNSFYVKQLQLEVFALMLMGIH